MVGQSGSGHLHPALGDAGASCLYVDPLVPEWAVGDAEQCAVVADRHRRARLFELALDGAGCQYRRLYLEEPAVLDLDPAVWSYGDSAGTLRSRCGRRREPLSSSDSCDSAADGEPVHRLRATRYRLRAWRF